MLIFLELLRRQEELRRIEEDMQVRRQMAHLPPPYMRNFVENQDGRLPPNFNDRGPQDNRYLIFISLQFDH